MFTWRSPLVVDAIVFLHHLLGADDPAGFFTLPA